MNSNSGFDPGIVRKLHNELSDLVGEEAAGELGGQLGALADRLDGGPDPRAERQLRALFLEHEPLHQRWLALSASEGGMESRSLFGNVVPPAQVRYHCKKNSGHEFAESEIERDALDRPVCPTCGALLEPLLGEGWC